MIAYSPKASSMETFSKMFSDLENCSSDERESKVCEFVKWMNEMDEKEVEYLVSEETFFKVNNMFEEKKLSQDNIIHLLKYMGINKSLITNFGTRFEYTPLPKRLEKIIVDEEKKKEGKNEKLLIDVCECSLLLINEPSTKLLSICVPCLLKAALKKDESADTQKEVEIALLTLGNLKNWDAIEKEMYLKEISEIIKYHQEHRNLTRLAYQSAWGFLISRFNNERSLEGVIVKELNFTREALRELEELSKIVDWKRNERNNEVFIVRGWFNSIWNIFIENNILFGNDNSELITCAMRLFKISEKNYQKVVVECIALFRLMMRNSENIRDLMACGAIDMMAEKMSQSTMNYEILIECLIFFHV
ncbi:uncharacterized protein MONOS_17249 [Monocercomonoides exilis]|uniref:uncharacterized protein n=1 Tax=Monocercomonoides exilis TaxID=2049356 RepID=UPI003559E2B1|nr:hypothetical protein MONOS_17249 [Monocercomonoides exilis]